MLSLRFCALKFGTSSRSTIQKLQYKHRAIFCNHVSVQIPNNKNLFITTNIISRSYSTEQIIAPADPDVFGDIGGHTYERMDLDKDDKELEEFEKNESPVPRQFKPTIGQYNDQIKGHIARGDLDSAVGVLDLIKENRDKPTKYTYNLLIRAFALQGNMKKCLKYAKAIKVRQMKHNGATYTSLINACANCPKTEEALNTLNNLRQQWMENNVSLNETHYNAMVKAYGRHNRIVEAFQIVDIMVDKRMSTNEITMNSLLYASISNKHGLKYALTVWHLMRRWKIRPSLLTYNLLLRAIRDTDLGDLKINDRLLQQVETTQIRLNDDNTAVCDLLSDQPSIPTMLVESVVPSNDSKKQSDLVSAAASTVTTLVMTKKPADNLYLADIHAKNRLTLFGGFSGFIKRMEADNVTPDAKTLTLLMNSIPNSIQIEEKLIATAREKKIPLDIDFYNMLIKKRNLRNDYKEAKKVLDDIQVSGLTPNVITWGVLALGCHKRNEVQALLSGMQATNHTLNAVIAGTIIANSTINNNFIIILEMMDMLSKKRIRPTKELYSILDNFQQKISKIVLGKVKSKHSKDPRYRELFSKFNMRYASFQKQFGRHEQNQ